MKEGLFTSELGTRSDEADGLQIQAPTRTLSLSDMQRGKYLDVPRRRPQLVRRNAAIHLPRAPDATVTSSVVDINVAVGSTTLDAATIAAAATSDILVSVSSLGTLTVSAVDDSIATDTTPATDSSQSVITSTPPSTPSTETSSISSITSYISTSLVSTEVTTNGTITSQESTVTVTATSTLDVSYNNGTFVLTTTSPNGITSGSSTKTHHSTLQTGTISGDQSSNTAVFGSAGSTETSFQSGGSAVSNTNYVGGGGAAATSSSNGAAASSTSSSGSGGKPSGPGLTPTQQSVVGGVLGGVAGIGLVLLIILIVLRWYRRRLQSQGRLPEQQVGSRRDISTSGGESFLHMSERSSNVPLAATMASFGRRLRPQSSNTVATTATGATGTTVPEPERGFQRIAGRKIAPVIAAGVDQYGGNYGAFERDKAGTAPPTSRKASERELAGTSFYRDSGGFYGGKGPTSSTPSPAPTTPSAPTHSRNISITRDFAADSPSITASKPEGFAVLRPSPARTPTTRSPSNSSIKLPIQQAPTLEPEAPPTPALPAHLVAQRDAIGRSLASQDGSRVSKGSGSRFSERI